jgi:hypothetical protein
MGDDVVAHPFRELLAEAQREREIADTPKARALQCAIAKAVADYEDYLIEHGILWEEDPDDVDGMPRFKATGIVITNDWCGGCDITLKDGALDRVYGNGKNSDPYGRGPPDIPHRPRTVD